MLEIAGMVMCNKTDVIQCIGVHDQGTAPMFLDAFPSRGCGLGTRLLHVDSSLGSEQFFNIQCVRIFRNIKRLEVAKGQV